MIMCSTLMKKHNILHLMLYNDFSFYAHQIIHAPHKCGTERNKRRCKALNQTTYVNQQHTYIALRNRFGATFPEPPSELWQQISG